MTWNTYAGFNGAIGYRRRHVNPDPGRTICLIQQMDNTLLAQIGMEKGGQILPVDRSSRTTTRTSAQMRQVDNERICRMRVNR